MLQKVIHQYNITIHFNDILKEHLGKIGTRITITKYQ